MAIGFLKAIIVHLKAILSFCNPKQNKEHRVKQKLFAIWITWDLHPSSINSLAWVV